MQILVFGGVRDDRASLLHAALVSDTHARPIEVVQGAEPTAEAAASRPVTERDRARAESRSPACSDRLDTDEQRVRELEEALEQNLRRRQLGLAPRTRRSLASSTTLT